ncbi:MAG: hypothetical protein P8Y61_04270 [Gammaproteobacteria bacterium]
MKSFLLLFTSLVLLACEDPGRLWSLGTLERDRDLKLIERNLVSQN